MPRGPEKKLWERVSERIHAIPHARAYKINTSQFGHAGFPDTVIIVPARTDGKRPARTWLVELKAPGKPLTPKQEAVRDEILAAEGNYAFVSSIQELEVAIGIYVTQGRDEVSEAARAHRDSHEFEEDPALAIARARKRRRASRSSVQGDAAAGLDLRPRKYR